MDSMDVIHINATEGERATECLCKIVRRLQTVFAWFTLYIDIWFVEIKRSSIKLYFLWSTPGFVAIPFVKIKNKPLRVLFCYFLLMEPPSRFELETPSLPWKCSTTELRRQVMYKHDWCWR